MGFCRMQSRFPKRLRGGDDMPEAVAVATLSLLGTLLGSLAGVVTSSKLINFRLEQLERKVQAHNNLIERTFQLEAAQALLEQRLDRLERED